MRRTSSMDGYYGDSYLKKTYSLSGKYSTQQVFFQKYTVAGSIRILFGHSECYDSIQTSKS